MSLALASRRAAISPAWVKNPLWRTARAVPSLDLPFADIKSLADAVTGQSLVTFTRASSGTSVGSDGLIKTAAVNEPRFDHNPTTGESLGLLVEEQRTNLLLRSEEFDNASWTRERLLSVTANAEIAPNGYLVAERIVEDSTASNTHTIYQAVAGLPDSTTFTFSVYLKAAGRTKAVVAFMDKSATTRGMLFDLSQGTVSSFNLNGIVDTTASNIAAIGNGWYRCSVQQSSGTGAFGPRCWVQLVSGSTNSYTGDGTSGLLLWGAQLEAGAFPTSYIPTTTAAATRSADVASITGTNFSSWYRQDEGTVFADINTAPVANIAQALFDLSEGAGSERIFQRRNTGGFIVTAITDNGVVQGDFGSVSVSASGRARSGFAYRLNDFEAAVNGSPSGTDTSATVPTPDRIHIGQNFASGQVANGTIRRLTYWPQRLPNSTIQAITQ